MTQPGNNIFLGIEIGGTKLQVVRGTGDGIIQERCRMNVDQARGAARIREQIQAGIETMRQGERAAAIGVGFGGPVDRRTGQISLSYQVDGWADFSIVDWLTELTGLPVAVDNDANVAALGEARRGAGKKHRLVFYTNLGSGMGGGMVIDGHLYHGMYPGESEVGLMCFDPSGATVESHCCGWAVDARIRRYVADHPQSQMARLVGGETRGEARFLSPALALGDSGANTILQETAADIAFALSLVAHLFHPEIMVMGGGLSLVGEPLRAAVAGHLPRLMTRAFQPGPQVALAALGEDAVGVGALLLAADRCCQETKP